MIAARAPFRISLAGGGTDLPAYYEQFGGCVVSTSINKYFYVVLKAGRNHELRISSADHRALCRLGRGLASGNEDFRVPRAVLDHFGVTNGISMSMASEVPPGTGLGSSSAVAVALIKVVSAARGIHLSTAEIAELACDVEIRKLGTPAGKQDQYASAFGGLNFITFERGGVHVHPLRLDPQVSSELEKSLMLFYTGLSRDSGSILTEQKSSSARKDKDVLNALHCVKQLAFEMRSALEGGELDVVGELLNLNWQHKKRFASRVTQPFIDECYQAARANGATGGKLTGAGGGGFLMLFCRPDGQARVTEALHRRGLTRMEFGLDRGGVRILANAPLAAQAQDPAVDYGLLAAQGRTEWAQAC